MKPTRRINGEILPTAERGGAEAVRPGENSL
jgi:hypothetical protein